MFGRIIGTSIAVDWFQGLSKNGMFFLSEGHLREPLPDHVDRIYTSIINADYLRSKLDPDRVVGLSIDEKLLIQDKVKKLNFYVTLIDARQKPGAVMFLFEGEGVGNILYAGRCCYPDSLLGRSISSFMKLKRFDYLYVHDACTDCHNHSMSPSAAVEYIVSLARRKLSSKVIIYEPCFREDILAELKTTYGQPICVSEEIMNHLEKKGRGSDFSLDQSAARIYVTHLPHERIRRYTSETTVRIILIPCSMKRSTKEVEKKLIKLKDKGYRVVLYRNHCSPPELVSFVHDISAKYTVLLRPQLSSPPSADRKKDLTFWAHLGNFNKFIEFFDMLEQETEEPMEVNEGEAVDAEITPQSSVDCIAMSGSIQLGDSKVDYDKIECGAEDISQDPLVILDSDIDSLVSRETVLNTVNPMSK